jgi:hypothetical protein
MPRSIAIANDGQPREGVTIVRRHPGGIGVQTVVYTVRGNELVRMSANNTDVEPDRVVMLDQVERFETRMLSQGVWTELAAQAQGRVTAIEIAVSRNNGDRYVAVLPI